MLWIFLINTYAAIGPKIWQDGRLPRAQFAPSQISKDAILKDENIFSSKRKLLQKMEKGFLGNETIQNSFCSKLATSIDFVRKSIFSAKTHPFLQKTQKFEKSCYTSPILRQSS